MSRFSGVVRRRSLAELNEGENADEKVSVKLLTTYSRSCAIKGRNEMWLYFKGSLFFLIDERT